MKNVIVSAAITGMIPTKEMTPYIPITPKEIIETVLNCAEMGVQIFHIHPRDEFGKPTWKKEVFKEIIGGIRNKNNKLFLSVTTSGRDWAELEKRSDCLNLDGDYKPDLASLTTGSMNFIRTASVNSPEMLQQLATKMMDKGIKPELEIFEVGHLYKANHMLQTGIIKDEKPYFNILLGSLGTSPLHPSSFAAIHALLPKNAEWSLAGIGQFQLQANLLALTFDGNIRIGLEDNIYFDSKKQLVSNEKLIERILNIMNQTGHKLASLEETGNRLNIIR